MTSPADADATCEAVTLTLRGETHVLDYEVGETIVQAAYRCNVQPPVSCLSGSCATCMARLVDGRVEMLANDVLTPHEIAQGYVLTCQSVPLTRTVTVNYDDA
jgi:ferredoxin